MRTTAKLGAAVATGVLAIAVPAAAHPVNAHPSKPDSAKSHKCVAHNVAYTASGTLVSWSATPTSDGRFSGTITVDVTRANHHAAGQKGTSYTYTLTNTRVRFAKGTNPPVAGDRVKLIGAITSVAKKCTDQSGAGTITVRKVDVSPAKKGAKKS
jgi:hypothetical protein